MCGIAGVVGDDPACANRIADALAHRGPDASGAHVAGPAGLAHRRLSIVDLESGDQPIRGDDGAVIVANGEIYNHRRIRRDLAGDVTFATSSDSEAALQQYLVHGPAGTSALDGMFAFAVADRDGGVYLARDPVGIKPLYLGNCDSGTAFASELKALDGYRGLRPVLPGHHRLPDGTEEPYRTLEPPTTEAAPAREHARRVRLALERAVEKRLMADVPVGVFLSGGLDSSIIAALVARRLGEVHSFSVGIAGSDDLTAARRVADHLGTIHHEHTFDPDEVRALLPEIVHHLESFDQDLVRSAIPTYFVSRLAAEHVKVILTGEGADELFAGYTYYRGYRADAGLQRELQRSVRSLHDSNLQRVDRMTMAHSIEGRVPFLDPEVIAAAEAVPPELKLHRPGDGRTVEKWILRLAAEDLLPDEIAWRTKAQFDEGSGLTDVVDQAVDGFLTPGAARHHADRHPDHRLRSTEEAVYHHLLADGLRHPRPILDTVGRWADRPPVPQTVGE